MLRKVLLVFIGALAAVAIAAVASAPSRLASEAHEKEPGADLDQWLAESEQMVNQATPIIPGAEKRIVWFNQQGHRKTRYAVVYLHGFSATRQEIAPVAERVAHALQANLFETRLAGHGLSKNPLTGIRAEDWLDDAAEALSLGARLGDEIVLLGTSTGATLALAMADHPLFERVSDIVLMSPNFGPRDSSAEYLTLPGGPWLAYLIVGPTRSWTSANELQQRYWSTTYPTDALVEMMRLVDLVRGKLPRRLSQALLVFYSPQDRVVDSGRITAAFEQLESPRKQLTAIEVSGDRSSHVLAGDILSPGNTENVVADIVQFVSPSK